MSGNGLVYFYLAAEEMNAERGHEQECVTGRFTRRDTTCLSQIIPAGCVCFTKDYLQQYDEV